MGRLWDSTQHVVDENYARLKDGQYSTLSEVKFMSKWNYCFEKFEPNIKIHKMSDETHHRLTNSLYPQNIQQAAFVVVVCLVFSFISFIGSCAGFFSPLRLTLHTFCLLVGRRWNMEQEEEEREKQQSEVGRGENNDRRGEGVAQLGGLCVSLKRDRWLEILHRSIKRELQVTA